MTRIRNVALFTWLPLVLAVGCATNPAVQAPDGNPGRDPVEVVDERGNPHENGKTLAGRITGRTNSRRWHAHLIPFLEFVLGPDPAAVNPHFPTTQQPVYPPFRYSGQLATQEIVNTLPCLLPIDENFSDFGDDRVRACVRLLLHDQ